MCGREIDYDVIFQRTIHNTNIAWNIFQRKDQEKKREEGRNLINYRYDNMLLHVLQFIYILKTATANSKRNKKMHCGVLGL